MKRFSILHFLMNSLVLVAVVIPGATYSQTKIDLSEKTSVGDLVATIRKESDQEKRSKAISILQQQAATGNSGALYTLGDLYSRCRG